MSLSVVHSWLDHMLPPGAPRDGIGRFFEHATRNNLEANVLAGSEVTATHKPYLLRWTGTELIVRELSRQQQLALGFLPHAFFTNAAPKPFANELPEQSAIAISELTFNTDGPHDGWQPLTGSMTYSIREMSHLLLKPLAIRVTYFRPTLTLSIDGYCYLRGPLIPPGGTYRFAFDPFWCQEIPPSFKGPLILYFQLFAADDWAKESGCQRVSNVASAVIELR